MKVAITGGLGFIGSDMIRYLISESGHQLLNIDSKTYAATEGSVRQVQWSPRYSEANVDICDAETVSRVLSEFGPDIIIHMAAESHVDRSIDGPGQFIQTNIIGTYNLLQAALGLGARFVHVSTDEVFGSLGTDDPAFTEQSPYDPHSPYSASKAASDHLVRAWGDTYGLDYVITNCSINFGPFQFPEKLVPSTIIKAFRRLPVDVYGTGENVRDWIYVRDHVRGVLMAAESGGSGETYLFGTSGVNELTNLEMISSLMNAADGDPSLIRFVEDRPGHDHRYGILATKARRELGWEPLWDFHNAVEETVAFYRNSEWWWGPLFDGARLGATT